MDKTVIVGIGLVKWDGSDMTDEEQNRFITEVTDVVEHWGQTIYFQGEGHGTDEKGQLEPSYTIVASASELVIQDIKDELADLAQIHHQRAIAVTVGETDIVPASAPIGR